MSKAGNRAQSDEVGALAMVGAVDIVGPRFDCEVVMHPWACAASIRGRLLYGACGLSQRAREGTTYVSAEAGRKTQNYAIRQKGRFVDR